MNIITVRGRNKRLLIDEVPFLTTNECPGKINIEKIDTVVFEPGAPNYNNDCCTEYENAEVLDDGHIESVKSAFVVNNKVEWVRVETLADSAIYYDWAPETISYFVRIETEKGEYAETTLFIWKINPAIHKAVIETIKNEELLKIKKALAKLGQELNYDK